jgi:hypothetical protein
MRCGNGRDELVGRTDLRIQQARRLPWHVRHVNGEQAAIDALAWYADCSKPAHIVLLVDQILQLSSAACPEKAPVWVMSLVRFPAAIILH